MTRGVIETEVSLELASRYKLSRMRHSRSLFTTSRAEGRGRSDSRASSLTLNSLVGKPRRKSRTFSSDELPKRPPKGPPGTNDSGTKSASASENLAPQVAPAFGSLATQITTRVIIDCLQLRIAAPQMSWENRLPMQIEGAPRLPAPRRRRAHRLVFPDVELSA